MVGEENIIASCTIPSSGSSYCYNEDGSFTATADGASCQVQIDGQIPYSLTGVTQDGPMVGIAASVDGSDQAQWGTDVLEPAGSSSVPISLDALINVAAGSTVKFGVMLDGNSSWAGKTLNIAGSYLCFEGEF